jgi:hypothetical protein
MKEEEINRLIEKYYNGDSTEEEERAIRAFFRENIVPEGYETEKAIFNYYAETEDITEPSPDFEDRILAGIDASERNTRYERIKKYLLPVMSAAAGLLILGGSYFFFVRNTETANTYKDPKIAYAETMKILMNVSERMNRSTKVLERVGKMNKVRKSSIETLNKSTRIVEEKLKSLNYLQKAIEMTHVPEGKNVTNKNQ